MLTSLESKQYNAILGAVPRSINEALECPPLQELINLGANVNDLEACLALEIAKIANMLTVGGNLRQGQSLEIAKSLVADYPGESLQDFCLCLRNGIKGCYGDIFRFDVLVIHGWFKQYLQEKYNAVEEKLMREKDNQYKPVQKVEVTDPERHQQWLNKLKAATDAMGNTKSVPQLSDKEKREEGQVKPKKIEHERSGLNVWAEYANRIVEGRKRHFKSLYPNATEEDIDIYLNSFNDML